jgi:hypothetical protein
MKWISFRGVAKGSAGVPGFPIKRLKFLSMPTTEIPEGRNQLTVERPLTKVLALPMNSLIILFLPAKWILTSSQELLVIVSDGKTCESSK